MKSPAAFSAMCTVEYHLPPFVAVAVGSSRRPPSTKAPEGVVIFVHCAAVWVSVPAGRPTVCAYQMLPPRNTGAERTYASCTSILQAGEQAEVPATGLLCGSALPLGCAQPPPVRVSVPP